MTERDWDPAWADAAVDAWLTALRAAGVSASGREQAARRLAQAASTLPTHWSPPVARTARAFLHWRATARNPGAPAAPPAPLAGA